MEHHTYFLRCAETDKAKLYALAVKLGVLELVDTEEGQVYAPVNCAWDEIGHLQVPTGETVDVDGEQVPVMQVKTNADGVPYWHINLATYESLDDIAQAVFAETGDMELGAALADMGRYFVVGEDGRPARPEAPARVFL
jgi:hypothetical protein